MLSGPAMRLARRNVASFTRMCGTNGAHNLVRQQAARAVSTTPLAANVTYAAQSELPPLPVPPLDHTLDQYLLSVEALVDEDAFATTKAAVEDFRAGKGPELHQRLLEHAATQDNWLEVWWDHGYIDLRDPNPINVNYAFGVQNEDAAAATGAKGSVQADRAARLTAGALEFKALVDRETLPAQATRAGPLCMNQTARLFHHNRRPAIGTDLLHNYGSHPSGLPIEHFATTFFNAKPNHIAIIAPSGRVFTMDVANALGARLSVAQLTAGFDAVVAADAEAGPGDGSELVPHFTTTDRDLWAMNLESLEALDPSNAEAYARVASSIFVVALDAAECGDDVTALSRRVLHGDGAVRWYDKHQLIVTTDGRAGWNFEHAPGDGTTTLPLCEFSHKYSLDEALAERDASGAADAPALTAVEFKLDDSLRAAAAKARDSHDSLAASLQMDSLFFEDYGSDTCKAMGTSPDGLAQMAMQLAYYKLAGRCVATYESAAMRGYLHGRTETVRSCSNASMAFVKTFTSDTATAEEKADTLRAAASAHVNYIKMCSMGRGVDRHLLGMKLTLKDGEELPPIYQDPAFAESGTWRMSTSNCSNPSLQFFSFGPVCGDGLGIGYLIDRGNMSFTTSSWDAASTAGEAPGASEYLDAVQASLREIRDVVLAE